MLMYLPRLAIKLKTKFSTGAYLLHCTIGFPNCRFSAFHSNQYRAFSKDTEGTFLCNSCPCQDFAALKLHFAGERSTEGDTGCKTRIFFTWRFRAEFVGRHQLTWNITPTQRQNWWGRYIKGRARGCEITSCDLWGSVHFDLNVQFPRPAARWE